MFYCLCIKTPNSELNYYLFHLGVGMVPFIDLKRQYQRIEKEILAATKRVYERGSSFWGKKSQPLRKSLPDTAGFDTGLAWVPGPMPSLSP